MSKFIAVNVNPAYDLETQKRQLQARGICVIIPTYNNEKTIEKVVRDTLVQCADVIVVNDGCTDNTSAILNRISDITVVEYCNNRGKGHALKMGFKKAKELGFAYAITIDADGQHYPEDIHLFLEANKENPGSIIVGKRNLDGVIRSKGSSFANKFSNFWFWLQTGRALEDTQTGYRLYPLKKMKYLGLLPSRYEAELALMVFASWHGVKLISIPVNVYYPPREERVSHFRPGMDFARISMLNAVLCFLAVVYGMPLRLWRFMGIVLRTLYTLAVFLFFSLCVVRPLVWLFLKLTKKCEKQSDRMHTLIYRLSRFLMITHGVPGTSFKCKLDSAVDFNKPHIIICNHQSHLDLMCQLVLTPKIVFMTNDWVWNNPFYGLIIRNADFLQASQGLDALMPKMRRLVERGYSIAIYPEGTRSKDCRIRRFHQGAFYIAKELNLDVLPMCLYGAGKVLKKGTYHLCKGQFYIEAGRPIPQTELHEMGDTRAQAKEVRKRVLEKYEEIANEIEKNV